MKKFISVITTALIIVVLVLAIVVAIRLLLYLPTVEIDLWFRILLTACSVFIIASIMCFITAVVVWLIYKNNKKGD